MLRTVRRLHRVELYRSPQKNAGDSSPRLRPDRGNSFPASCWAKTSRHVSRHFGLVQRTADIICRDLRPGDPANRLRSAADSVRLANLPAARARTISAGGKSGSHSMERPDECAAREDTSYFKPSNEFYVWLRTLPVLFDDQRGTLLLSVP